LTFVKKYATIMERERGKMEEWTDGSLINSEAIEALTPEQIEQALAILTKAGY
jgi:hypothetical protein